MVRWEPTRKPADVVGRGLDKRISFVLGLDVKQEDGETEETCYTMQALVESLFFFSLSLSLFSFCFFFFLFAGCVPDWGTLWTHVLLLWTCLCSSKNLGSCSANPCTTHVSRSWQALCRLQCFARVWRDKRHLFELYGPLRSTFMRTAMRVSKAL